MAAKMAAMQAEMERQRHEAAAEAARLAAEQAEKEKIAREAAERWRRGTKGGCAREAGSSRRCVRRRRLQEKPGEPSERKTRSR